MPEHGHKGYRKILAEVGGITVSLRQHIIKRVTLLKPGKFYSNFSKELVRPLTQSSYRKLSKLIPIHFEWHCVGDELSHSATISSKV